MKRALIVAIAVLACMTTAVAWSQDDTNQNETVVTVNDEAVTSAEVRLVMRNLAVQMQREGIEFDAEKLFNAATQQVVDTKLLAQEARRNDIDVSGDELETIMSQIEQQSGGREAVQEALIGTGVSYDVLRAAVRESEIAQMYVETKVRPTVVISDEEIATFYADNPEMFNAPEQVRARHILIRADASATEEQRADARKRAEEARQRALVVDDFGELAKELSEGPSAPQGGDLGFFTANQMVKPFADAAFALDVGAISEVVETDYGYHVIKVEERRPAGAQALDDVRDSLRSALVERKVAESVGALITKLRSEATIVPAEQPGSDADAG